MPKKVTREYMEQTEQELLADYAVTSAQHKGRVHKEPEHPYRTAFQRDRDRITYSTAFRRLQYKTQVFVNYEGDHYRTRLTHTLEVTQIARTIARALLLNEDLVETIALAHDIGHTPFGHSGETAMHELMQGHGGFEHNLHALRIVDYIEIKYPDFKGLNLTWDVREGIIKHKTEYDTPRIKEFNPNTQPSLEAQVVNIADEIAYNNHDLDDGITSGLISMERLDKIKLWHKAARKITKQHPACSDKVKRSLIIKELINYQVTDLIQETKNRLKKNKIDSVEKVRKSKKALVGFSDKTKKDMKELSSFLYTKLYMHPRVIRMSDKAARFIGQLFNVYLQKNELLPLSRQQLIKQDGIYRVICDYIAGMTDRFALNEYKKLFDPYERV